MSFWNVKFNHSSNRVESLRDASEFELSMGDWFMESLSGLIKKRANYSATALGFDRISSPEGDTANPGQYYFLNVLNPENKEIKFLFQLEHGDECSLVGVSEGVNRFDAEKTLLDVVDGKMQNVEMLI